MQARVLTATPQFRAVQGTPAGAGCGEPKVGWRFQYQRTPTLWGVGSWGSRWPSGDRLHSPVETLRNTTCGIQRTVHSLRSAKTRAAMYRQKVRLGRFNSTTVYRDHWPSRRRSGGCQPSARTGHDRPYHPRRRLQLPPAARRRLRGGSARLESLTHASACDQPARGFVAERLWRNRYCLLEAMAGCRSSTCFDSTNLACLYRRCG